VLSVALGKLRDPSQRALLGFPEYFGDHADRFFAREE
jgi:hypothetical protein